MSRVIEILSFPLVLGLALFGYDRAVAAGLDVWLAAYAMAAVGLACIVLHEIVLPERRAWRPARRELWTDLVYLVLVQMLWPQLLALLVAVWLASLAIDSGWAITRVWPHEWSVWAQLLLLTVAAEFPRYWLHRFMHTTDFLWRFHAVHHAPKILYTANVGRFHPIDKGLQYLVEVAPFIVIGVRPEVLGLYYVFYAVTGFYQHANCRVRLGPLNWLIAGPELHRWHHALDWREGNSNYGNKLIIWDTLFGTRFLPQDRDVGALGIPDPAYPTGFMAQMAAPFQRRRAGR